MVPHTKIIIHINNDMNINIHIDININMNIEDYKEYYLLIIRYSLLGIPYWLSPERRRYIYIWGLLVDREKAATGPDIIGVVDFDRREKVGNTTRLLGMGNTL